MKRIMLSVIAISLAMISYHLYAQDATAHLKFKQIEIKGKSNEFFTALKEKGFEYTGSNQKQMYGTFAGQEVTVSLDKTVTSETVYQVQARMKPRSNWTEVEADYALFKANLIRKYGEAAICKEKFHDPYRKGDGYEIKAALSSKLEYISCWVLPEGEITIQIIPVNKELCLLIRYSDAAGNRLLEEEKTELFLQDL